MVKIVRALAAMLALIHAASATTATTGVALNGPGAALDGNGFADLGAGPMQLGASGGGVVYQIGDSSSGSAPSFVAQPGAAPISLCNITSHVFAKAISSSPTFAVIAAGSGFVGCGSSSSGGAGGAVTQSGAWNIGVIGTLPAFASTPTFNLGTAPSLTIGALPALPNGSNVIGGVTQSGTWNFGLTGTLPAFAATPTFNIGTAPSLTIGALPALPTGANTIGVVNLGTIGAAATSALQTALNTNIGTPGDTAWDGSAANPTAFALWKYEAKNSGGPIPAQAGLGVDIGATEVAPDAAPASLTITAADAVSSTATGANSQSLITGTPTANSAAVFSLTNSQTLDVQVTGTWVGTLATEVSIDGGATWYSQGLHQIGTMSYAASFTANFGGELNVTGRAKFRVRATAYTSGTATVAVRTSANNSMVQVGGAPGILTPKLLAALTNATVTVKSSPGSIGLLTCSNQGTGWAFVQVFNVTSGITLGSTAPVQSYGVPPGMNGGVVIPAPGLNVNAAGGTGIAVAASTTQTGSTAPGTPLDCNAGTN